MPTGPRTGPSGRDDADRLVKEAIFLWKHRHAFLPSPRFVPPPQHVDEPLPFDPIDDPALREDLGLDRIGQSDGPSAEGAVAILSRARGTARELRLVEEALKSRAHGPLPDVVRFACADILAARGYRARALAVLEDRDRPPDEEHEHPASS